MRNLFFVLLFLAVFLPLPSESSDSGLLFLRGRVAPSTNAQTTEDGVLVSSNNSSNISIKLHKRGRAPASLSGEEKTFISRELLLKENVDLIQIEAP